MAVPKAETVPTRDFSTQGPYEEPTEEPSPEGQRVLLTALEALEESDVSGQGLSNCERAIQLIPPERYDEIMNCISAIRLGALYDQMCVDATPPSQSQAPLPQTSRQIRAAERARRIQQVVQFRNEPGLERLLSYFCPRFFGEYYPVSFKFLNRDLLTKTVPDILEVLGSSTDISDDERNSLCKRSLRAIVDDPNLLRRVLQAAYDISLVSLVGGVEEPQAPLPDLQDVPTLEEKARSIKEWLSVYGPSVERICFSEGLCVTCLPEEICALTNLSYLRIVDQPLRALPHLIGNLRNLRGLVLSGNRLSFLPPEIGDLCNLTELHLEGNRLSFLPPEINALRNLQRLYLENNPFTTDLR